MFNESFLMSCNVQYAGQDSVEERGGFEVTLALNVTFALYDIRLLHKTQLSLALKRSYSENTYL